MLIDTHAHLNFSAFKDDCETVIKKSLENGIWLINVGAQYETSKKAVELAEKYQSGVYASIGLHPIHALDGFDEEKYQKLAESKKVVAIGEIGLDYKREYLGFKKQQKEIFLTQLALAQKLSLPVIFHCRLAQADLIKILATAIKKKPFKGVIHCFTGDWADAEKYLKLGFYLGFNGIIFKLNLETVIKKTPLEKILLETDCPYLTPPQFSSERNEPLAVQYVAQRIAEIKNLSYEEISKITTQNAQLLFNL